MTDLLTATSIETLNSRMRHVDSRTILSACAAIAAEIDGSIEMGNKPTAWDQDRFDAMHRELEERGTFR
jgi:hypothetical protein